VCAGIRCYQREDGQRVRKDRVRAEIRCYQREDGQRGRKDRVRAGIRCYHSTVLLSWVSFATLTLLFAVPPPLPSLPSSLSHPTGSLRGSRA